MNLLPLSLARSARVSFSLITLALASTAALAAPAAPSNLRLVSTTWNSFTFAWNDNANDETSQPLYISEGGQPFYLITSFRSDSTTASLQHLNTNVTYKIYLTAKNASGESAPSNTLTIFIPPPPLAAAFGYDPLFPTADDELTFYDWSRGSPTSFQWDFGDGTSSNARNPKKRFAAAGTYNVTLTVRAGIESSSATRAITLAAGSGASTQVTADFSCGECRVHTGESLSFVDASLGAPTTWSWDFGDGTTSSLRAPQHSFVAPGEYRVTLLAKNASSSSATTRTVTVLAQPLRLLLPAAARTEGANGSNWRTEMSITNLDAAATEVTLTFVSAAGLATTQSSFQLDGGQTRHFDDLLRDAFSLQSGSGAVTLSTPATTRQPRLAVQSRTFSGGAETFGQSVPATRLDGATTSFLGGLESDESYRTNVGLTNASSSPTDVTLTLSDASGASMKSVVTLPASSFRQQPLAAWFATPLAFSGAMTLRIDSRGSDVSAYASVVDNVTQDPTFVSALQPLSAATMVIPIVGRTAGAEGTYWRTDVTIVNTAAAAATISLSIPHSDVSRELTIGAGATLSLRDVVSLFGLESASAPLTIRCSDTHALVITSRTYTTRPAGGTLGQSIDAVDPQTLSATQAVTGLRDDESFRTNLGVTNLAPQADTITLQLKREDGSIAATTTVTVDAKSVLQRNVRALFPELQSAIGRFRIVASSNSATAQYALFASVIDNGSGDPSYVRGE